MWSILSLFVISLSLSLSLPLLVLTGFLSLIDITHDSNQVLYRSCLAIDKSTLTQCRDPVVDVLAEETHCPRHTTPVGGDSLPGRPPPRKKIALQQSGSRQSGPAGRVGGVASSGGGLKVAKRSGITGRGMAAVSKVCTITL